MKLSKEEFIEKLNNAMSVNDINIGEKELEQLYIYKELLIEWNEKINLTAITDDEEIIWKHFVDSALGLKHLTNVKTIADVGTGAGLPGLVIAICNKNIKVTLIDALQKRITFLNEVINKLGLTNVVAIHARAEELGSSSEHREKYDAVISRAVARLNILMELTVPYAKANGKCIYMKSEKLEEEISESQNAVKVLSLKQEEILEYELLLDTESHKRKIIIYSKQKETPNKYARQFAKIKKMPL